MFQVMNLTDIVPFILATFFVAFRLKEVATRRETKSGTITAAWTFRAFVAIGLMIYLCGLLEWLLRGDGSAWGWWLLGALLGIASIVLRRAAIHALGSMWSLHNETREEHRLSLAGPFAWMRHPVYTSMYLENMSLLVLFTATWSWLWLIPFSVVVYCRIREEERDLREQIPGYANYAAKVPALLPWRGRVKLENGNGA